MNKCDISMSVGSFIFASEMPLKVSVIGISIVDGMYSIMCLNTLHSLDLLRFVSLCKKSGVVKNRKLLFFSATHCHWFQDLH